MPDICIDVPQAYTVLEKFVTKCHAAGFLADDVLKKLPSRLVNVYNFNSILFSCNCQQSLLPSKLGI